MAKPNYQYEKRQRELEKKRKKEDKAAQKRTPGDKPDANDGAAPTDQAAPGAANDPAPAS